MKRRKVTIEAIREYAKERGMENVEQYGIMALVDVYNMGWCKDGVTRWYHFYMDGIPCVYFKH